MQRNWIGRSEGATIEFVLDPARARPRPDAIDGKVPLPPPEDFVAGAPIATGRYPDPGIHHPPGHHLRRHQLATRAPASAGQAICPGRRTAGRRGSLPGRRAEEGARGRRSRRPSKSTAASPATMPSTPSAESACPSGWPTTSCSSTEPAPSCRCRRTTSAITSLPKNTGSKCASSFCPGARGEPPAAGQPDEPVLPYTEEDSLLINSGEYNGLGCQEAQHKMAAFAEEHGFGQPTVTFRLEGLGRQPPALLGRAHPRALLPQRRHRARAR